MSACYQEALTYYAIPELQWQNALSEVVWTQDGASPHVGSSIKRLLNQQFGDRVTFRHFPFPWPPRSSDLTPMDLWLWVHVKSKVYQFHVQTVTDLKDVIRTAIQEIPIAMVCVAVLSTICRMQGVTVCEGGHVENL